LRRPALPLFIAEVNSGVDFAKLRDCQRCPVSDQERNAGTLPFDGNVGGFGQRILVTADPHVIAVAESGCEVAYVSNLRARMIDPPNRTTATDWIESDLELHRAGETFDAPREFAPWETSRNTAIQGFGHTGRSGFGNEDRFEDIAVVSILPLNPEGGDRSYGEASAFAVVQSVEERR
jgi:hypothetical protein